MDGIGEIVLVDPLAELDSFGEAVDFHRAAPRRRSGEHRCDFVGACVKVVDSAVVQGSGHAIAA